MLSNNNGNNSSEFKRARQTRATTARNLTLPNDNINNVNAGAAFGFGGGSVAGPAQPEEYHNYGPQDIVDDSDNHSMISQSDDSVDNLTLSLNHLRTSERTTFAAHRQVANEVENTKAEAKRQEALKKGLDDKIVGIVESYEKQHKQEGIVVEIDGKYYQLVRDTAPGLATVNIEYVKQFIVEYVFLDHNDVSTAAKVHAMIDEMYSDEERAKRAKKKKSTKPKLKVFNTPAEIVGQVLFKHR